MKIILDNIKFSTANQGGISNYWFELSKSLLATNPDVFFYENSKINTNFHRRQLAIPRSKIILDKKLYLSSIQERIASVDIEEKEPFVFHSSYYRTLKNNNFGKEVTTVHDFTHNFYASFFKKQTHNYLKYSSIKKATGIICISKNTYSDLKRFCPPTKNQKVSVIYNGVSNDFYILENDDNLNKLPIIVEKNQYILFVGSRQNYKNFDFAASLFNDLKGIKLLIVGEKLSRSEQLLFKENSSSVSVLTNVNNEILNILYNNALAFIYPSSYEGFGIPIIEAMKAGCPVIALNNSSIPEVAGNAALLLNDLNVVQAKNFISDLRILSRRENIIEKGFIQSKQFSWEKCTDQTKAFYDEIF